MFDERRIGEDFSGAAQSYDAHASLQRKVLARLMGHVPQGARLLDAGCGTGSLARQWGGEVTQLDRAFAMCRQAAVHAPCVQGTVEALPFAGGSFDAVVSSLVLQWLSEPSRALAEMLRVTAQGGMVAVSTFGEDTLAELKTSFRQVDAHAHVSDFIAFPEWQALVPGALCWRETVVEQAHDLLTLMRRLKALGARNKMQARRKSLMTRRELQRVEAHYRTQYGTASGLPVTWDILYAIVRKP